MEIKIKRVGQSYGTVGWLKKGLENGTLEFYEGNTREGDHSLFFRDGKNMKFVGGFNQHGFDQNDKKYLRYDVAHPDFSKLPFTPACNKTIESIAREWCREMNDILDREEYFEKVKIVRVKM